MMTFRENMQLTEDQYRIFKYDYMNKLISLISEAIYDYQKIKN